MTLLCDVAGKSLRTLPEEVLPREVLDRELDSLSRLGVTIREGADVSLSALKTLRAEYHAVFVDYDDVPGEFLELGEPDAVTLAVGEPGVFAFGPGETSPIGKAEAGRRAANSVDRFAQGVPLNSRREQEGPCPTRLFTSLDKVDPVSPGLCRKPPGRGRGQARGREVSAL